MRRRFAHSPSGSLRGSIRRSIPRSIPRGFTLVELIVVIGVVITLLSLVLAVSTLLIQQNESRQLTNAFKVLESAVQEYEIAIGRPLRYQDVGDTPGAYEIPLIVDTEAIVEEQSGSSVNLPFEYQSRQIGRFYLPCNCSSSAGIDIDGGWQHYIIQLVGLMNRTDGSKDMLARLDPNLLQPLRQTNGDPLPGSVSFTTFVDPWGTPLAVVMPGRAWNPAKDANSDVERYRTPDVDGTVRTALEEIVGVCRNGQILFVSAGPDGKLGCLDCDEGSAAQFAVDNIYSYEPAEIE